VTEVLPGSRIREVRLPAGVSVAEAVARYERSPAVRFAEPDYILQPTVTPNDPRFRQLYGMHNTGQTSGTRDADVDMPEAWNLTTGSPNTVVAVIDTGVDIRHPDLAANIWTNPGEVAGNGVDDDNNGYVDDVHGWDFFENNNSVFDGASDMHGTHVAGTIAGRGNNNVGVAGISWRAKVMPVKFLGPNGGLVSDAVEALDYAVANGARVSNNSWGGSGVSLALQQAIQQAGAAGHLFVAAAGNAGSDIDVSPTYPAAYPEANIVSVAAGDHNDRLATFSNYGSQGVDLAAPGVSIMSTLPGNTYGELSGTSMATPHVTGAVSLLLARQPRLTTSAMKRRLLDSADTKAAFTETVSGGRLNVRAALGPNTAASVTLAVSPGRVTYGNRVGLSGRLTSSDAPLADRTVVLQHRPLGAERWRRVPDGVLTTAADGTFRLRGVRPAKHTDYRARFAGTIPVVAPATSPRRRGAVRIKVSLSMRTRDLGLGGTRTLTGTVAPRHTGSVRVVIARGGTVIARPKVALVDSRYRFTYRPSRAGRYTFRTVRPGDRDHLRGSSPVRALRVTR